MENSSEVVAGVLVIDKPSGWTSHDVVNRVRRLAGTRRVGHLGTLDPMATGVLPLMIGRITRLAKFFASGDKVYEGTIQFGFSTDTYDAEGVATSEAVPVRLDPEEVERELGRFQGTIQQIPPAVSAKKVGGVAAYKLARKQIAVELTPVTVEVFAVDLVRCGESSIDVRIHCGPGTYMRSIAHDLGQALGFGAHLSALRRTSSTGFDVSLARSLEDVQQLKEAGRLGEAVIPGRLLLPNFPVEVVDLTTVGFIRQGRDFRVSPFRETTQAKFVKAVAPDGELIAIGEARLPLVYHPVLVL